jgi:hypothetical protein
MHKNFTRLRISCLSVFLNGATLTCHAKAPDRRPAWTAPRAWALGPRVRWGWFRRQTANRRVAVPATGIAARRRWRDVALASARCRLEGFGRPARLRVLRRRGAVLSLRGSGAPVRACGVPFSGTSLGAAVPGLSRALEAVPEAPSGASGGLDGRGPRVLSPTRQALQAHAVGLALGACCAARARRRRRRLRMLVCPSPSSGDAAPQRGRRSSRGRRRIARFGATARGAEIPPARPSRD